MGTLHQWDVTASLVPNVLKEDQAFWTWGKNYPAIQNHVPEQQSSTVLLSNFRSQRWTFSIWPFQCQILKLCVPWIMYWAYNEYRPTTRTLLVGRLQRVLASISGHLQGASFVLSCHLSVWSYLDILQMAQFTHTQTHTKYNTDCDVT
jgi:hypothetical protein